MMCCRVNVLTRVVAMVGFVLLGAPLVLAADKEWTSADSKDEVRGNQLLAEDRLEDAEAVYRGVLERHPDSARALDFHVEALNRMGRFEEALNESKKALDLEPDNALAAEWYGIVLGRIGATNHSITILEKAHQLDPDEEPATIWLAREYLQAGRKTESDKLLNDLVESNDAQDRGWLAFRIANIFYKAGDPSLAIDWFRKSYDLGSKDAAHWLAWAYESGYGVPQDEGGSDYWERRSKYPPFAWFPNLPFAASLIHAANGWSLVGIMFLAAALIPIPTIALVAWLFSWGVTTDPAIHWSERARRSYPYQSYLSFCMIFLPVISACSVIYVPRFLLPVPKWMLGWTMFAIAVLACNAAVVRAARRYREKVGPALQNLKDTGVLLFIYMPTVAVLLIMSFSLPDKLGLQAALTVTAGILAYFWMQYNGWIRLGRLLHILTPASPALVEEAANLARKWQHPAPTVWMINWRKGNAFAFPFANAIVVTEKLREILSADEMRAILAHELAHLCEGRGVLLMRLWVPLLLLVPLFTVQLWLPAAGWIWLPIFYVFIIVVSVITRRWRRRMEERADTFGKDAESEAGVYALALAKLYEANLIPAVMPGKRKVHPHLYDRLVSAGIMPDYPRPKPPAKWGLLAVLLVFALNVACLGAVWLSLF